MRMLNSNERMRRLLVSAHSPSLFVVNPRLDRLSVQIGSEDVARRAISEFVTEVVLRLRDFDVEADAFGKWVFGVVSHKNRIEILANLKQILDDIAHRRRVDCDVGITNADEVSIPPTFSPSRLLDLLFYCSSVKARALAKELVMDPGIHLANLIQSLSLHSLSEALYAVPLATEATELSRASSRTVNSVAEAVEVLRDRGLPFIGLSDIHGLQYGYPARDRQGVPKHLVTGEVIYVCRGLQRDLLRAADFRSSTTDHTAVYVKGLETRLRHNSMMRKFNDSVERQARAQGGLVFHVGGDSLVISAKAPDDLRAAARAGSQALNGALRCGVGATTIDARDDNDRVVRRLEIGLSRTKDNKGIDGLDDELLVIDGDE
jgi:hypothetical protein